MTDKTRKSQGSLLPLGTAFAVTAVLPLAAVTADAATGADKLSALRAAANAGQIELLGTTNGQPPARIRLAGDGFDNSAPADTPPLAPDVSDTEKG